MRERKKKNEAMSPLLWGIAVRRAWRKTMSTWHALAQSMSQDARPNGGIRKRSNPEKWCPHQSEYPEKKSGHMHQALVVDTFHVISWQVPVLVTRP